MSTNDELKNETANGTKPVLAVVYRLSNSDKEKVVKIPKNAKNIIGNGIYLNYEQRTELEKTTEPAIKYSDLLAFRNLFNHIKNSQ